MRIAINYKLIGSLLTKHILLTRKSQELLWRVPPRRVGKNFYNSAALRVVSWDILGLLAD